MKTIGSVFGVVVVFFAFVWVVQGNDFFMYQFFAPKYEQTRRQVFEQTKSYNQGMIQELRNAQLSYAQADNKGKDSIASYILHQTADFDDNKLPSDLRAFVAQLRTERR